MDPEAVRKSLEPTATAEKITGSTPARLHFYDPFVLSGVSIEAAEHGRLLCSFVVTPRLASPVGYLRSGVTATLADQLGSAVFFCSGLPSSGVSIEISVSFVDAAAVGDENEEDDDEEEAWIQRHVLRCQKRRRQIAALGGLYGMFHFETYMNKEPYRVPTESGYQWVMRCLGNRRFCYNMFRMHRNVFDKLHNVLVESYGLKSTRKMSSIETLGLFLWMCGAPQGMRQAEDRFFRSTETCSRKFDKVLHSMDKLAADIIKPRDPEFRTVHQRLQSPRFTPYFDNCIGAIDGTHVPVVVPSKMVVQHTGRHRYTTQNVLAVCDFDMRFTFVVAGWPGSVHDMRVFKDATDKYGDKFPHPLEGKFYLVDSGYPNQPGYLAPYRGTKYHLQEYREGPMPRGGNRG